MLISRFQIRKKMGKILAPQTDGKASVLVEDGIWKDRLSSWDFAPRSPALGLQASPQEGRTSAVYHGTPRVLELGCSDGTWCFGTRMSLLCLENWLISHLSEFKKEQPDWYPNSIITCPLSDHGTGM
jgi:hypothetical protein